MSANVRPNFVASMLLSGCDIYGYTTCMLLSLEQFMTLCIFEFYVFCYFHLLPLYKYMNRGLRIDHVLRNANDQVFLLHASCLAF